MKKVWFPIGNYYGIPYVYEVNGKYYVCIDDHGGDDEAEISKEFYEACAKEFPDGKEE